MARRKFKILLVNPPSVCLIPDNLKGCSFYDYLKKSEPDHEHMPGEHLGIQYIAAYLDVKRNDTVTYLLNACVESHVDIQQTYDSIKAFGELDLIGFTGPYNVFEEVLWLAEHVKKDNPNTIIIYGQYFASLNYEQILAKYSVFDYLCVGDGEIPFERFIAYLNKEIPLEHVPSFAYMKKGKCVLNHVEYNHAELKTLTPRRDCAEKVLALGMNLSIAASRGCPYRCSFCASGSLMSKGICHSRYLLRDPVSVVDELEYLIDFYRITRVVFVDDTFASNIAQAKAQARQIAVEILKRNLHISIMIDTRVDCIEEGLFRLLRSAGVVKAFVGVETINSTALNNFNKGYKKQDVNKKLATMHDIGIKVIPGIINFNPTSTLQEIKENVDFIFSLGEDVRIKVSHSFIPYPGTILTKQYIQSGNIIGEFPYYSIKYDCPRVAVLEHYFSQFHREYTKTRIVCNPDIKSKELEHITEYFIYKMLDIAACDDYTDKAEQCFVSAIEEMHSLKETLLP